MPDASNFTSRYGPRALVAGAAVGLGAEYARQIANRGLDLVLVDRDEGPLRATADAIRRECGVEVTAVRRRNIRALEPTAETRFEAGDVVVLLGVPGALGTAESRLLKG